MFIIIFSIFHHKTTASAAAANSSAHCSSQLKDIQHQLSKN